MAAYSDSMHPDLRTDLRNLIAAGRSQAIGEMLALFESAIVDGVSKDESPYSVVKGHPLYVRCATRLFGVFTRNAVAPELVLLSMSDRLADALALAAARV